MVEEDSILMDGLVVVEVEIVLEEELDEEHEEVQANMRMAREERSLGSIWGLCYLRPG